MSRGFLRRSWQEDFGASAQAVGWSSSVFIAGFGISGLISSFISAYVSCRWQSFVGGAIAAASLSCSYWISNLTHLYIIMGISGFGAGLSFTNSIIVIAFYFKKKLALACGLGLSGSPIGIFILAPLIRYLNDEYSWRGAMTICGALLANLCVFTALFRMTKTEKNSMINLRPPLDVYDEIQLKTKYETTKSLQDRENTDVNNEYSYLPTEASQPPLKPRLSVAQHISSFFKAFVKPYATVISVRFVMMCVIGAVLSGFSNISALLYFVSNAISLGVSKTDAAFLLSIYGICSCFARITLFPIIDKKFINPSQLGSFVLAIGGLACLIGSLARTYATLVVFAVVLGLSAPQYNPLLPLITKDVVGIGHYKKILGPLSTIMNFASIAGLPIIGHVYDITGKYAISLYLAGSVMILNSIIAILDPVWQSLDRRLAVSHSIPVDDNGECEV